ncbi:MAG: hypothetical protein H7A21_15290 [Spirochaetales bacterium]|nr:hypothetical protein [Leptospiraceae bacterium]MCP5482799.1 hypothetical protein [Spirochaetales bacterium]
MSSLRRLPAAGATGALIAVLMLITMAFIPRPGAAGQEHFEVLTGRLPLEAADMQQYVLYVKRNLAADGIYLVGQGLMWVALGLGAVRKRSRSFGIVLMVLGLLGVFLDLFENSMRWSLVQNLQIGGLPDVAQALQWKTSFEFSLLAVFLPALLVFGGISRRAWSGRLFSLMGGLGLLVLPALYFPGLRMAFFVWLIAFHLSAAAFLLHVAGDRKRAL